MWADDANVYVNADVFKFIDSLGGAKHAKFLTN
jgi:hypothetical protein